MITKENYCRETLSDVIIVTQSDEDYADSWFDWAS